jgi:type II secretory pathway component PulC
MLPWIIQMSIISLILIILVHYLFTFFKTNLTIPKVKDLVNKPQEQYEKLFDNMSQKNIKQKIPIHENDTMKDELKNYLKELSGKKSNEPKTNVNQMGGLMTVDTMGSSAYSSF